MANAPHGIISRQVYLKDQPASVAQLDTWRVRHPPGRQHSFVEI